MEAGLIRPSSSAARDGWAQFDGPAIVEQYDATTVVYPGWFVETDGVGNLVLGRVK